MDNIKFDYLAASLIDDKRLGMLSELYSNHYGVWDSSMGQKPGEQIKLSVKRLREWLRDPDAAVYFASLNSEILGYAIAVRKKVDGYGAVSWVTQLVVHKDYRNQNIAKRILFSIWGLSNDFAWGILSANPYAIRALEKSTRRRSIPMRIKNDIHTIMEIGEESLPYISQNTDYYVDNDHSRVNTKFFIDHADIPKMLEKVISEDMPWRLGDLPDGWEWLAFTFRDQDQMKLSKSEIEEFIATSDDIAQRAYARMDLSNQPWMKHTNEEVQFVLRECGLEPGMRLIDFGCGIGRHDNVLAGYGIDVVGVDYVESNITMAKSQIMPDTKIQFWEGDCRSIELGTCDAAICLYDVVGSYVRLEDNQMILNNIARHLKTNGIVIISVINFDHPDTKKAQKFTFEKEPDKLLELTPSTIMEHTGDVFDKNLMLVDSDTHIIYRREQFTAGGDLPAELVVRDRRFTQTEIIEMCEKAGLQVKFSRYVRAGDWENSLIVTDDHAKEILLKCQKV